MGSVIIQKKNTMKIPKDSLIWRGDGRIEWACLHGCCHTIWSPNADFAHCCDGCCSSSEYQQIKEELSHRQINVVRRFVIPEE